MKYIPQYVYYNLLAHILFLTSSYVLVSVLYRSLAKYYVDTIKLKYIPLLLYCQLRFKRLIAR